MSDFRQYFLEESINNLKDLQKDIAGGLTGKKRREAFRIVHTVKGGSQMFDCANAAQIAGKIEDALGESGSNIDQNLLVEGIGQLISSLHDDGKTINFEFAAQTIEKKPKSDILLTRIAPQIFKNFSRIEQSAAMAAIRDGKNILCAEIGFQPENFADEYRRLRKSLGEKGEIIASLPSVKFQMTAEIGFQIFIASRESAVELQNFLDDFPLEISSHTCDDTSRPSDLFQILSEIAAHGEKIADAAGKEIRFSVLASDTNLSDALLKAIFDTLLHLIRNAVVHAFDDHGIIEIRLFDDGRELFLSVADDGRGIDLDALHARAIERELVAKDDILDEEQLLSLVFVPELSTADQVTEISGRGIGLNAVKKEIENLNGKIFVRRRKTNGTIFEFFLPKERV